MSRTRGERNFVSLPGFAALLYDHLMKSKPTMLQYQEIAQDLVSRLDRGRLLDIGTGPGFLLKEVYSGDPACVNFYQSFRMKPTPIRFVDAL